MISGGCFIESGARVESCVLSPGVRIRPGAVVRESILITDCVVESGAVVERAILDKKVHIGENARVGGGIATSEIKLAVLGKKAKLPAGYTVEPGAEIGTDVIASDYEESVIRAGQYIQTRRLPNEL
jgi:glucose-1-phosphate adenylyltransferase